MCKIEFVTKLALNMSYKTSQMLFSFYQNVIKDRLLNLSKQKQLFKTFQFNLVYVELNQLRQIMIIAD